MEGVLEVVGREADTRVVWGRRAAIGNSERRGSSCPARVDHSAARGGRLQVRPKAELCGPTSSSVRHGSCTQDRLRAWAAVMYDSPLRSTGRTCPVQRAEMSGSAGGDVGSTGRVCPVDRSEMSGRPGEDGGFSGGRCRVERGEMSGRAGEDGGFRGRRCRVEREEMRRRQRDQVSAGDVLARSTGRSCPLDRTFLPGRQRWWLS